MHLFGVSQETARRCSPRVARGRLDFELARRGRNIISHAISCTYHDDAGE